jgi:hypothetical protein
LRHAEVVVLAMIPLIDMETLAAWVATLVAEAMAIIRAAGEAVVAPQVLLRVSTQGYTI